MNKITRKSCKELEQEYQNIESSITTKRIQFYLGENDKRDVYNICAPFDWEGEQWIAGRVEDRDSELSEVCFFTEQKGVFIKQDEIPRINLQDPFFAKVNHEIIIGGVEVYEDPEHKGFLAYHTIFYKGTSLYKLERFAMGPEGMKDIRLLQLNNKDILVFTRPQGVVGGRGKIGFTIIQDIHDLCAKRIEQAVILDEQFYEDEWGGANELHLLRNKKIGVLSHIARFDEEGNRHYYSSSFCFEPSTEEYSPMKIIAVRSDFEPGAAKRPDLVDVIFSGGLVRLPNGKAELYCGVSDAEAHVAEIPDPFLEYEVLL